MDIPQLPSQWIQAHAGSGKTYQLVEHITRLLIEGEPAGSILCMTYTNAAAAEMRERLGLRLRALHFMEQPELRELLHGLLGREPSPLHLQRAHTLMLDLLDAVPEVQFFTLHGFCQSLLTQFPLEAGVPATFALLDDKGMRDAMGASYQALLNIALQEPALRDAFDVMQQVAKDGAVESLLCDGLKSRREWQRLFGRTEDVEPVRALIKRFFALDAAADLPSHIASHYMPSWSLRAAEIIQLLEQGKDSDIHNATVLATWAAQPKAEDWLLYAKLFLTEKGEPRKRLCTESLAKKYPAVASWLADEQEMVLRIAADNATVTAASLSDALTLLMHHLLQLYEATKIDRRALDFDDLLLKARDMLADDGTRPWVMYKLDQRLRHILLDEAQDTSPEQWAIMETLLSELWQTHSDESRSLLVVGDLKQSIYSFQGALPHLFVDQQAATTLRFSGLGASISRVSLATSRRSAPLILAVVDKVLESPCVRAACISETAIAPHNTVHQGQPARVVCWPGVRAAPKRVVSPFEPHDQYPVQSNTKQLWAHQLAETIAGWIDGKRLLASRGRPVMPSDILILLQTRSMADPIIRALQLRGIPVAGLDRLTLSTHLAVRDHIAFIEWALHPYDDYHLAIALRSPLGGLSEDDLYALAHDRAEQDLWSALLERMPGHAAVERFSQWREYVCTRAPHTALQHMHADGWLRRAYSERFGEEVLEILDALLGEAVRFVDTGGTSARAFASWLAGDTSHMKREQEQAGDKVRIMTVHGAKGLESPIVILADAFDAPTLQRETIVFTPFEDSAVPLVRKGEAKQDHKISEAFELRRQAKFEEYYRLLYVALTRAEDEVYLGGIDTSVKTSEAKERHWHALVSNALRSMDGHAEDESGLSLFQEAAEGYVLRGDKHGIIMAHNYALPPWAHEPVAAADMRARVYSPSSLLKHTPLQSGAKPSHGAVEKGVIYHRILQWIEHYNPKDEAELRAWMVQQAPQWSDEQHTHVVTDIWRLYQSSALAWLWHAPSLREVNIAGSIIIGGKLMRFSGQIDRLVMLPEYRVIVDYKTSSPVPEMVDIPHAYRVQMLAYKRLLEADGSGLAVRAALLYTAGPTLYMVDSLIDDLVLPSLDAA